MDNFNLYAEYYNLLYKDKDYVHESDYIHNIIMTYCPTGKSILDLGCGSGMHDYELFRKGYQITGVDLSKSMLDLAMELPKNDIEFIEGDVRTIELNKKYDIVISLFHVLSYQQTNQDVLMFFETAKKHLNPGGIFIFDCWYGPGVLNDKPVVRKKELENDKFKIVRIAEPEIHYEQNIVDVNYTLLILDKIKNNYSEIKEQHKMRYFFMPEIELFCSTEKLELIKSEEWLSLKELSSSSWNAVNIVKLGQ